MRGPMINYRIGKMNHHEYEAEASRYWGQGLGRERKPGLAEKLRFVLRLANRRGPATRCAQGEVRLALEGCQGVA